MTLVASFRLKEIPVLIGDFLLTTGEVDKPHMFLPTRPDLKNTRSTLTRRKVVGLRKKIIKVGKRLVVGFTGNLLPGEKLIRALVDEFGNKSPTKAELEKFLSEIKIADKGNTWLVGWLWENRPLCFRWRGSKPDEIEIVPSVYWGTGGRHFQDEIMRSTASAFSASITTELEKGIYMAVTKAGKILFQELLDAGNLDHAYGFGAEVIYWDGGNFSYVDTVGYQFWTVLINPDNTLMFRPASTFAIYKNFETFSVLQVSHLGEKANGAGFEAKETYLTLITPMNDAMPDYDVSQIGRLPFTASYWFTGVQIVNLATGASASLSEVSDGSDDSLSFYKDGMTYLNIQRVAERIPLAMRNN